jgi:PAS domain S-box-containing protein
MQRSNTNEDRILILAPRGRDAQVIEQVLAQDGLRCTICTGLENLMLELEAGAATCLIAEEALHGVTAAPLAEWLSTQASWSDFPFVLMASKHSGPGNIATRTLLESFSNAVILERPVKAETLRRAAASALRARKRQYQARRDLHDRIQSEERLRMALQAGHLGSWELHLEEQVLEASAKCKADFGRGPLQALTYADLAASIHPSDRERHDAAMRHAIASLGEFDIEFRVIWPDASMHWVQMQGKISRDPEERPLHMVGVTLDVTERREAERSLQESQKALMQLNETLESRIEERTAALAQANDRLMNEITERERAQIALIQTQKMEAIGRLTGGIAHDFNNLLSIIQGNIDLIDLVTTDERVKRMANAARRATGRGAKLTKQMLAFARSQRLDLKAIDLTVAMEGIGELLAASLGASVEIAFDLTRDLPLVKADLNQIELALLNLTINARDAMAHGGKLTIRTSLQRATQDSLPEGDYAVISVTDNGPGINSEILPKVFDPFFTTKGPGKGTGLGLSQVYGIAQQSGGTARVFSEPGHGATVEIWLPLAAPGDVVIPETNECTVSETNGNRAKILVVEDEPAVRQFMVESLEILGYSVSQAENGEAALHHLDSARPDLVITDFLMPGISGAEVVARALEKFPGLPVLFATGYADMDAIDKVMGDNIVLRKPFHINELSRHVQLALRKRAMQHL